eukprot:gene126-134_t
MMQSKPGMRRLVSLMEDNRTPELWDEESIDYVLDKVELALDAEEGPLGNGMLYITSKRVIWLGSNGKACDFDVPYITLHAVSRDTETYPKPCIYCQLDTEDDSDGLKEMFLIPEEELDIMKVFEALSHAALINPDPLEDGEEEGDDDLIYNEEEVRLGAEQARILDHLDSVFVVPSQFQGESTEGDDQEEDSAMHAEDEN